MVRAAHLLWDDRPKNLPGYFRFGAIYNRCAGGVALRERLDAQLTEFAVIAGRDLAQATLSFARSVVVMRSRYVEDELDQAIKRGVAQYVILRAGLDSFAYRRPDLANVLRAFEVDHPAIPGLETDAPSRISEATPPIIIAFCSAGFRAAVDDRESPELRLPPRCSGILLWLGVTLYLTPDAIFDILRAEASMAPGTVIIFEYNLPVALLDDESRQIQELFMNVNAARGEPLVTFFEPADLAQRVRKFAEVWDLGPEEANAPVLCQSCRRPSVARGAPHGSASLPRPPKARVLP